VLEDARTPELPGLWWCASGLAGYRGLRLFLTTHEVSADIGVQPRCKRVRPLAPRDTRPQTIATALKSA
jgi:hypothetical protein